MAFDKGVTAEEYLQQHRDLQKDFMSDEDIAEAHLMLDWFKESWEHKDGNNLFDIWDLIDDYYNGRANEPVLADDIGSNTNIINSHVEGQVALSWQDPVAAYVTAVDPSDAMYKRDAQAILDFIVKENRVRAIRDNEYRHMKKYGLAVSTVFWDSEALNGKGFPRFRNWNPRYVYFDPTITDPQDFQYSRYVILATRKSLQYAIDAFGEDKAKAITPGYHCVEGQWDLGITDDWDDYERENNAYIHLYVLTKRNSKKVRLVQMSGDGVILKEDKLIDDTYPVFFKAQMQCENHLYGRSTTYDLLPLQDDLNTLGDSIMRNAILMGNPQKLISSNAGIDMESWTNEGGLIISTTAENVDTACKVISGEPVSSDIFQRRNEILYQERPLVGRWNDNMIGTAQKGVDTATEAAALQSTGSAILDADKRKMQDKYADMLVYSLKLAENYWDTEMAFRITGKEDFIHIRPTKLKNIPLVAPASKEFVNKAIKQAQEDYKAKMAAFGQIVPDGTLPPDFQPPKYQIYKVDGKEVTREATYDINVDFGADMPTNKAFLLNAAKEAYLAKAIDFKEYRQLLHDYHIIPYLGLEDEQEIVANIQAQQDAQIKRDSASAEATIMNAMANNGVQAQGMPPSMQGMPGGTPMQGNPGAMMPNAMIPGMTGNQRVANQATQPQLALAGG